MSNDLNKHFIKEYMWIQGNIGKDAQYHYSLGQRKVKVQWDTTT